jgi:hypothetical protein
MEARPFRLGVNGQIVELVRGPKERLEHLSKHPELDARDVGYCALALFRKEPFADYLAIAAIEGDDEIWTPIYEEPDIIDWMAGFVYADPERKKKLKEMERSIGKFGESFGWQPDVILEDSMTAMELDNFITYISNKETTDGKLYPPE